ncbi:hypothetical protein C9374_012248 [Naegleria lovaniensis]|uniref:Uncharacterized protein n=1 Tax=Naegleria lovaniensis TaxID=51637 RepID=A0AA88G8D0_NAELO|nr:uncharacterized protein C9374_012248 [Naegleria lovaniensis]KAG2373382.1 hypothetical protein C9374_012248 [Naegleria lovaniensis]
MSLTSTTRDISSTTTTTTSNSQHSLLLQFISSSLPSIVTTAVNDNNKLNVNGYANITLKDVQPLWVSYSTLANSSFFLVCYMIYFFIVGIFLKRVSMKKKLKRNHKILLTLTVIFVGIQAWTQLLRIVNDSLGIIGRNVLEQGQLVEWPLFVAMNAVGGITTIFTFSNLISLFVILFVVQNIFWETAKLVRAISEKSFNVIRVVMLVVNVIFILLTFSLVLLVGVCFSLFGLGILSKNVATAVFVCVFILVVLMLFFDSFMVLTSGILVIKTIKDTTANTVKAITLRPLEKQSSRSSFDLQSFERRVQSPFKITFGLLIGMLTCMFMEVIAGGIASAVAEIETLRLVWYIFNCLGVLLFAVIVLFLFFPLFFGNENAFAEIEKRSRMNSTQRQQPQNSQNGANDGVNSSKNLSCEIYIENGIQVPSSFSHVKIPSSSNESTPTQRYEKALLSPQNPQSLTVTARLMTDPPVSPLYSPSTASIITEENEKKAQHENHVMDEEIKDGYEEEHSNSTSNSSQTNEP